MRGVALFSIVNSISEIREYMGISYIKAVLDSKNIECTSKVIYKKEISEIIRGYQQTGFPLLIGISMYCNNQALVREFCSEVKEACSKCYICVGGPQVMGYEREILNDILHIDFICTGEGELTILDLYHRLVNNQTCLGCLGISFRYQGSVYMNPPRPYIENLDELPFPYREMNKNNKKRYFYVVGSRGCLGRCTFCAEYVTSGSTVRLRSPQNIVDEIELLINKYRYNKIHFTDATFEDPGEDGVKRAKGIFEEIISRKIRVRMVMYTRCELVQLFDDEYYDLAYAAGVECFFVGIESGNVKDMKLYTKRASVADNVRAIKKIFSHNIYVNYGFICFNPYSTFETIKENVKFLYNSGLIYNSYHILSKMTIMPQALMKNKLLMDGLIDEFHYNSDITEYRFLHMEVKAFYNCLQKIVNKSHLIDYDSQIYIDYNHLKKEISNFKELEISRIFDEIFSVWEKRGKYLYQFFIDCIDYYIQNNYVEEKLIDYAINNRIHYFDNRLKQLYIKYLVEAQKLGIDIKNMSLV